MVKTSPERHQKDQKTPRDTQKVVEDPFWGQKSDGKCPSWSKKVPKSATVMESEGKSTYFGSKLENFDQNWPTRNPKGVENTDFWVGNGSNAILGGFHSQKGSKVVQNEPIDTPFGAILAGQTTTRPGSTKGYPGYLVEADHGDGKLGQKSPENGPKDPRRGREGIFGGFGSDFGLTFGENTHFEPMLGLSDSSKSPKSMKNCPRGVENPSFGVNFMEKVPRMCPKSPDVVETPSLGVNFMEKCRNSPNFAPKAWRKPSFGQTKRAT